MLISSVVDGMSESAKDTVLGLVVWRDGRGSIEKPIELGFHFSVYFVVCTHCYIKITKIGLS